MVFFVGETYDFVFDGRAIAWPCAFDVAGVHGAAMEVVADDIVGGFCGMCDVAVDLRDGDCIRHV